MTTTHGQGRIERPRRPEICIVAPCYNEAVNLPLFHQEVSTALAQCDATARFVFVDDGSTDDTAAMLDRLRTLDGRVGWVRLARNFGLQSALAAGLEHADADVVIVMDADLQDDPTAVPRMVERWRDGADVVYAVRTTRREGPVRRFLNRAFYRMLEFVADIPIPRQAGSFALYDRRIVERINALPERNRYLPGLRAWIGFDQQGIEVPRRARLDGEPRQSLFRLVTLAFDGLFAFSKAPLRLASLIGFGVTALSAVSLLVVVYWRFIERSFPAGMGLATIALALLFLGGVQLLVLGIIGEYLGRVYDEVKGRPNYVVMDSVAGKAAP